MAVLFKLASASAFYLGTVVQWSNVRLYCISGTRLLTEGLLQLL